MAQNGSWSVIKNEIIKLVITAIVGGLIALLVASGSNLWRVTQSQYSLDCRTESRTQQGVGELKTPCPSGYTLVGGGIQNLSISDIPIESKFERSHPSQNQDDSWECDIGGGSGYGQFTCYARCCKLK